MLHYGADYLHVCLESLSTACDKIIILYSLNPTHQEPRGMINRETMNDLKSIANQFDRVQWVDVYNAHGESAHLGEIWNHTKGYDVLVRSDYDEVWEPEGLKNAINEVYNSPYRVHGIDGFVNFWRSFEWYFDDSFRPVRLWNLREKNTEKQPDIKATIYHFGYAIRRRTMSYKMGIHGHRDTIRPDWEQIWLNWKIGDTKGQFHPDSLQIWHEMKQFDKGMLPEFMKSHKFYNIGII